MFDWRVNSNQVRYANAFAGIDRVATRTAAAARALIFISDLLRRKRPFRRLDAATPLPVPDLPGRSFWRFGRTAAETRALPVRLPAGYRRSPQSRCRRRR